MVVLTGIIMNDANVLEQKKTKNEKTSMLLFTLTDDICTYYKLYKGFDQN